MDKIKLFNDWHDLLEQEFQKEYIKQLKEFLIQEINANKQILPHQSNWFKSLNSTSYAETKVVILGQDPYPNRINAHGLSFSIPNSVPSLPKSLKNIFIELKNDLDICNTTGNLEKWASQGVLLLNTILTVEENKPQSHKDLGWEVFTDKIIQLLSNKGEVVFVLWGRFAQNKAKIIDQNKNKIIASPHPSPLSASRGFFNSKPFSKINDILNKWGHKTIDWAL